MMVDEKNRWPVVVVVVCTYDRPQIIRQTLASYLERLAYPNLAWHIADDGTPGAYVRDIIAWLQERTEDPVTKTITPRQGWGANTNKALQRVGENTDYVFFTEDDYILKRDLDLRPYVALMDLHKKVGFVRFGIAGHAVAAVLREADLSEWLPDYNENEGYGSQQAGRLNYWEINTQLTPGPFAYYRYSNRPHLKHARFHKTYGWYAEGLPLANTEHNMNEKVSADPGGPSLVCPANWVGWHFDHIGVSRQGTDLDRESSNG